MTTREGATGALAAAAAAALVVALLAPMATTVAGIILFGVLAIVLELRHLAGRLPVLARRDVVGLLLLLLAATCVLRLLAQVAGTPARRVESLVGFAAVAVVAAVALEGRRRVVAVALVGAVAVAGFGWPLHQGVVLLHVHQLVVLVFLWDWARRLAPRARRTFRAVQLAWAVVVPAVVLSGLLDRWLSADPGVVRSVVGDGQAVLAAVSLPDASGPWPLRLLTVLAFLQTVQLAVWVAFMPQFAPEEAAACEARFPWLTGPRVWAVGFIAAAGTALVFAFGYSGGQLLYGALWSWVVHVELAAAVVVIGARRAVDAPAPATPAPATPVPAVPTASQPAARPTPSGAPPVVEPVAVPGVAPEPEIGG